MPPVSGRIDTQPCKAAFGRPRLAAAGGTISPTGAVNLNPLDGNRFRRKRFGALLTQELNHGGRRGVVIGRDRSVTTP
jgi:hypothetical protein